MLELAGTLRQTTVSLVEVPAQGLDDVLLVIGSGALVARVSAGSVISGPGTSVSVGLASLLTSAGISRSGSPIVQELCTFLGSISGIGIASLKKMSWSRTSALGVHRLEGLQAGGLDQWRLALGGKGPVLAQDTVDPQCQ